MSKKNPEASYYEGKVDAQKEPKGVLETLEGDGTYQPPKSQPERDLYKKGWDDGSKEKSRK